MEQLKIQSGEAIKDWVLRVFEYFSQNQSKLGDEILKIIEEQLQNELSEKIALKTRLEIMNLINDLFDSPGEVQGISFEEISSLEMIFFPANFNSNSSCQFCLKEKSLCICSKQGH